MKTTCRKCGETKPFADFYKSRPKDCKECVKAQVRGNRMKNAGYYRGYDQKRFQEDPRVRERHRRYQKTEKGAAAMRRGRAKYVQKNPEKWAAHVALNNAVRDGRVTKPGACQNCGAGGRIEGHHDDYAKPLDVEWLCRSCHLERHR